MTAIPSAKAPNFDAFSVSCTAGPSVSINLHKGNLLQFWEGKTEVIDAQHGFYGVGMSIRHAELVLESSMSDSIRDEGSSGCLFLRLRGKSAYQLAVKITTILHS